MTNPRDIRQRQLGALSASLLLHGGMAIAITLAPTGLTPQPKELADAVYIDGTGDGLSQGDQTEALPAAGTSDDPVAQAAESNQAGDTTPVAVEPAPEPVVQPAPPVTVAPAAPSEVVVAPLPPKKSPPKPEPKKVVQAPKPAPVKKSAPPPAPAPKVITEDISDVDQPVVETEPESIVRAANEPETMAMEQSTPESTPEPAKPEEVVAQSEPIAPAPTPAPEPAPAAPETIQQQAQQPQPVAPAAGAVHQAPAALSATTSSSGAGQMQAPGGAGSPQAYGIRDAADLKSAPGNRPPEYPERDRLMRNQGTVVFLARVRADGTVSDIRIEQATQSKSLDTAALEAMKKWRFLPGQEGMVRKGFTFSLDGETQELPARLRR